MSPVYHFKIPSFTSWHLQNHNIGIVICCNSTIKLYTYVNCKLMSRSYKWYEWHGHNFMRKIIEFHSSIQLTN
jgi:hypothetical protein